jgi:hypothetical protein
MKFGGLNMQVGRRVYYDLATGNVIQDTGERQGSVVETTTEQDFISYVSLAERVPLTVGFIQLEFGELIQEFSNATSYHIDLGTKTIIFNTSPAVPILDIIKQRKIAEFNSIEDNALLTFKSSALGVEHTYLSAMSDMLLLTGEYAFVKGDDFDNQPILWYTVENGNMSHTAAQFIQIYLDCRTNVQTIKYHRAILTAQVNACTTQAQVESIVW